MAEMHDQKIASIIKDLINYSVLFDDYDFTEHEIAALEHAGLSLFVENTMDIDKYRVSITGKWTGNLFISDFITSQPSLRNWKAKANENKMG